MSKSLKIGFDAKRLFHNHTGLGNYGRTLVRDLQRLYPEHEYHLFTPKISKHPEVIYFLDNKKFTIHTHNGKMGAYWRSRGVTKEINAAGMDIYHGLSHEIPLNSQSIDAKTVVTFHDLIFEYYPKQFGLWDRYMYKRKYRYAAKNADQIVAISESTKKDLNDLYQVESSKVSVVYQSCHPAFYNTPKSPQSGEKYLLYVGSLIERKSFMLIVEAMATISKDKRTKVKVVGKGGLYADQVKAKISELSLDNQFEFLDHIDNEALLSIYDNAIAMVYPSIYEGFGIPLIESLYRDTPVITTTASSLPEAAGPGAIYIEPNDKAALADAMMDIVSNDTLRSELAQKGKAYVSERYSDEISAKGMMEVYMKMMD